MSEVRKGVIESIYSLDFFGASEPYPYLRTVLKQIDALLEGRDSEWDDFGMGVIQGMCMAAALQHKREGLEMGHESLYGWDDAEAIRERGCLRELRQPEVNEERNDA